VAKEQNKKHNKKHGDKDKNKNPKDKKEKKKGEKKEKKKQQLSHLYAFRLEYHDGFYAFEQIRGGYLWTPDKPEERMQTTASCTKTGQFYTTYLELSE